MSDPRRLLDEASTNAALRSLLESARREDDPGDGRVTALTTRLGPLLAPLAPLPASVPVAAAGKGIVAAKVGGALVAAGVVVGGAWVAYDRIRTVPEAPPQAVQMVPEAPVLPPVHQVTPDTPPPPALEPPAPRDVDRNAEATLVQAAQAALLRDDAKQALALMRQHATRFAAGAHAEERDRIAIEALVKLGRSDDARAQAQRFFTRYPRSIYRARIEALVP